MDFTFGQSNLTRARTWDPMIKSPDDHQVYQWHMRKPDQLGAIDFVC
jgi:hypothetical protein